MRISTSSFSESLLIRTIWFQCQRVAGDVNYSVGSLLSFTRIPAKWETDESFRKVIWERINKRISRGKISDDKDGKD